MQMVSKQKHAIVMLLVMAMLFSMVIPVTGNTVSAAEPAKVIKVYYGKTLKAEYTMAELKTWAGDKKYDLSTYNSFPTYEKFNNVPGIPVEFLITKSGIKFDSIPQNHRIQISSGKDSYSTFLTKEQLTEPRYYYPNGAKNTTDGLKGNDDSKVGKVTVPAIINLDDKGAGKLMFGQKLPNEQTNEAWCKYVASGGSIIVTTQPATKLRDIKISAADPRLPWGSVIKLVHDEFSPVNKSIKMYYTTEGSDPADPIIGADVYNYGTSGRTASRVINLPVSFNDFTVKAYAAKYGYLDSEVSTATFSAIPNTVTGFKTAVTYNSVNISWNKKYDVDSTDLMYSTSKNGPYTLLASKTSASNTYLHSNLKAGTTYYYKTVSYKDGIKGAESVIYTAKPSVSKPTGVKAKAKKSKKVVITAKKVVGASGIDVYRSTKKKSGFKKIKTVKKATLKYTDKSKKLKKGKKYYYKVVAYRTVDGKKMYGAYSSVVSVKVK